MDDELVDDLIQGWLADQEGVAPMLKPTLEMRRLVEARRRRKPFLSISLPVGLSLAGAAAAVITLFLLFPDLLPGGRELHESIDRPHVGLRDWVADAKDLEFRGATPERVGGRGAKGDPGGAKGVKGTQPTVSSPGVLLFQYHRAGSKVITGINLLDRELAAVHLSEEDDYRIVMRPSRRLHIRIFQLHGRTALQLLYPEKGREALAARQLHFAPAEPAWFQLSEVAGPERLVVVAALSPLEELDTLLLDGNRTGLERHLSQLKRSPDARVYEFTLNQP